MINPHKIPLIGNYRKSLESLRRQDERGLLYYIDYSADYYPLMKVLDLVSNCGCTTFITPNMDGDIMMGRNFDLTHFKNNVETEKKDMTGLIVAVHACNPKAKYKSIGVADAYWLDSKGGTFFEGVFDDGKKDISMALFLPFVCMDGVNEAGLAVSIMHLPTETRWDECEYVDYNSLDEKEKKKAIILNESGQKPDRLDTHAKSGSYAINEKDHLTWRAYKNFAVDQNEKGKAKMLHPVLMRLMLDDCATVDEAIEKAKSVNVKAPRKDADYHILVADKSGRSVMIEWINNELNYTETNHGSNYYLCRDDHYGYGYERDDIVCAAIRKYKKGMPESCIKNALELASQNSINGSDVGFTQWSSIYNLEKKKMKLYIHLNYDECYEYHI